MYNFYSFLKFIIKHYEILLEIEFNEKMSSFIMIYSVSCGLSVAPVGTDRHRTG
jgi:hypothetical protein